MIIIPIGLQCTDRTFLDRIEKSSQTLPFDLMFATPKFVLEMLILLLEENMDIRELVENHFFICDKKTTHNNIGKFFTDDNGTILYNTKYNVLLPHDKNNKETIEKYIRRFERLKNIILNNDEEICFIYITTELIYQKYMN